MRIIYEDDAQSRVNERCSFLLVDSTDNVSAKTGKTPALYVRFPQDNTNWTGPLLPVEIGNGWYAPGDLDQAQVIRGTMLVHVDAGADYHPVDFAVNVLPTLPSLADIPAEAPTAAAIRTELDTNSAKLANPVPSVEEIRTEIDVNSIPLNATATTVQSNLDAPVSGCATSADIPTIPTAQENATAIVNEVIEDNGQGTTWTVKEFFRLVFAFMLGERSGGGTALKSFKTPGGTKTRVTLSTDGLGNTTAPHTLDAGDAS
jgi:hypothetical protein